LGHKPTILKYMSQPTHKIKLEALIGVFFGVIILYIAVAFALDYFEETHFLNKYSGTLESIFSSLAFAGLLYTIYQQQITIQTQVVEMRETRQQAITANDIFKRQTELLELQDLKTGFFKHYDESKFHLMSIDVNEDSKVYRGHQYFIHIIDKFHNNYDNFAKRLNRAERLKSNTNRRNEFLLDELQTSFNQIETKQISSHILPYLKSIVLNVEYHINNKMNPSYDSDYYQLQLRFSIEPEVAKLLCYIHKFSNNDNYPDFHNTINELSLWTHLNNPDSNYEHIVRKAIKEDIDSRNEED